MTLGVTVLTGPRAGSSGQDAPGDSSTYFVAGMTERGATDKAIAIHSMGEYSDRLGVRVPYGFLYDDLSTFFEEGGSLAYVARVVGPSPTSGSLTVNDLNGSPRSTLRFTAASPGSWSTQVTVQVRSGAFPNTFDILVALNGQVVEQYLAQASPSAAAAAMASSNYVKVADLGSITAAPANNPAPTGPTALTAGADDRADATSTSYVSALSLFTADLGAGAIAIPGQPANLVGAQLIAAAIADNRLAITSPPAGSTDAQAEGYAATLRTTPGVECAGLFWPWVKIPDGQSSTLTIPPDGFVAGTRSRTIKAAGPWQANMGDQTRALWVAGLEQNPTQAVASAVYDALVNPLRVVATAVEVYGWRSMSTDPNWHFLTGRDVIDYIAVLANSELERYVGRSIDGKGHLFSEIGEMLKAIVEPIAIAGGLYALTDLAGNPVDPGYSIDLGPAVNTPTTIAQGIVKANLGVRISPSAEQIVLTISKAGFTAAF